MIKFPSHLWMKFKKTNSIVSFLFLHKLLFFFFLTIFNDADTRDNKRLIHKNVNFFTLFKVRRAEQKKKIASFIKQYRVESNFFFGSLLTFLVARVNKLGDGNNENPFIEGASEILNRCTLLLPPQLPNAHNCYLWSQKILISIFIIHPPWSESIHILHRINSISLFFLSFLIFRRSSLPHPRTPNNKNNSKVFIKNADELINFKSTPLVF